MNKTSAERSCLFLCLNVFGCVHNLINRKLSEKSGGDGVAEATHPKPICAVWRHRLSVPDCGADAHSVGSESPGYGGRAGERLRLSAFDLRQLRVATGLHLR